MNPTCILDGENQVSNNCLANFSLYNIVWLWVFVSYNLQHCDTWLMAKCTKTVCTLLISHNSTITHKAQSTKWDPIIFKYFTGLFGGSECSLSSCRLQMGQKCDAGVNHLYINRILNTGFVVIMPLSSQLVKGLLCSFTLVEKTIWVLLSGST